LNRNITEYKWLAKEQGIPVLQVNEEQGIATARYRDIYRMPPEGLAVTLGPDTAVYKGTVLTMHAKISGGSPPYQILWNTLDTGSTLTVTVQDIQTYSVFVMDAAQRTGMAEKTVSIRYPQAVDDLPTAQLVIRPNPGYGMVHLTLPEICRHALISIMDLQGNIIRTYKDFPSGNDLTTDLSDLPEGPYIIRIATPETLYTTKYFQLKQSGK